MLDLNKPYTTQDVADLLASKDDSKPRQLRVDTHGIARISDDYAAMNLAGLAFRGETWDAGNGYTGAAAAADAKWVAQVEDMLRANWPNPTSSYIDH